MKTVLFRSAARLDILSHILFLTEQRSPETAERFSKALEQALESICEMPGIGSPRETINPLLTGLRAWPIDGFGAIRVYYTEGETWIRVVRVLHGSRDVLKLLDDEGM